MKFDVKKDALEIKNLIKNSPRLPKDTGNLRNNISVVSRHSDTYGLIKISISGEKVPYVEYLEEGTTAHDIPHAFGYGTIKPDKPNPYTHEIPYGVGGRFEGKWHPGSTKHKGFIENVLLITAVEYLEEKYKRNFKAKVKKSIGG